MNYDEVLESFIYKLKEAELTDYTLVKYKREIQYFIDFINSTEDKEINKLNVIKYKESLLDYATATQNCKIVIINKFIKFYELYLQDCDVDIQKVRTFYTNTEVKPRRVQNKTSIETISLKDYRRMMNRALKDNDDRIYMIMRVLGETGIRISELKYFTYENICKCKYSLCIVGKGDKQREIPITDDLKKSLLKYCSNHKIKYGYIFYPEGNRNECLSGQVINKNLKRVASKCKGIDLSLVHCHSFRHLFAIICKENGVSDGDLKDMLGHSNVNTTAIYTRSSSKAKSDKIASIKFNT